MNTPEPENVHRQVRQLTDEQAAKIRAFLKSPGYAWVIDCMSRACASLWRAIQSDPESIVRASAAPAEDLGPPAKFIVVNSVPLSALPPNLAALAWWRGYLCRVHRRAPWLAIADQWRDPRRN